MAAGPALVSRVADVGAETVAPAARRHLESPAAAVADLGRSSGRRAAAPAGGGPGGRAHAAARPRWPIRRPPAPRPGVPPRDAVQQPETYLLVNDLLSSGSDGMVPASTSSWAVCFQ